MLGFSMFFLSTKLINCTVERDLIWIIRNCSGLGVVIADNPCPLLVELAQYQYYSILKTCRLKKYLPFTQCIYSNQIFLKQIFRSETFDILAILHTLQKTMVRHLLRYNYTFWCSNDVKWVQTVTNHESQTNSAARTVVTSNKRRYYWLNLN